MALNMKKIGERNKADEMIDGLFSPTSESPYSSPAKTHTSDMERRQTNLTEEIVNTFSEAEKSAETRPEDKNSKSAEKSINQTTDTAVETVSSILKDEPPKKEPNGEKRKRGRRTKEQMGGICRVQFSTTLEPEMLEKIRAVAKAEHIPFSSFVERVFTDYFERH